VAPTGVETPGTIPAALRAFWALQKTPPRYEASSTLPGHGRRRSRPAREASWRRDSLAKTAGRAVIPGYLSLRIELGGSEGGGPEVAAILPTAQRFLFCLSDSYFVPAILILAQRSLSWLCDSYFGPAILPTSQRFLSCLSDPYFGPAILICLSDSYFGPAILILALRSLFWASDSYFGSAKNRSGVAALALEEDSTRRAGGGKVVRLGGLELPTKSSGNWSGPDSG
jgi:hypothetical protein